MKALLTEGRLKNHPFLSEASTSFLNHLEEVSDETTFAAGETIFREGDYADRFYLIISGKVALEASSNGEPKTIVQVLGPGDLLGWSWLFPPFEWHFGARALEPVTAVVLNAASLLIKAEEDPSFGYELMKRVSQQVIRRLQAVRKRLVREAKSREGAA